ncbi:MAG: acetoacetate decarboxylase [Spirochaetota bacterium]
MGQSEYRTYPPPWKLNGTGFIFLFQADKEQILQVAEMSSEDRAAYQGGLGAYILVNYHTSDVGPYYELLFIPGDFSHNGKLYKRITKIFVSTQLSVDNGKRNWAIPKEKADFFWQKDKQNDRVQVSDQTRFIADIEFDSLLLPFPVHTAPFQLKLLQKAIDGKYLCTKPSGTGLGRISKVNKFYLNASCFPPLENVGIQVPLGISVSNFNMEFPAPEEIM